MIITTTERQPQKKDPHIQCPFKQQRSKNTVFNFLNYYERTGRFLAQGNSRGKDTTCDRQLTSYKLQDSQNSAYRNTLITQLTQRTYDK